MDLAFSRDGRFILTAGGDEARAWDAKTFTPESQPMGGGDGHKPRLAEFSPDGKRVAAGFASDGFTSIWAIDPPKTAAPEP